MRSSAPYSFPSAACVRRAMHGERAVFDLARFICGGGGGDCGLGVVRDRPSPSWILLIRESCALRQSWIGVCFSRRRVCLWELANFRCSLFVQRPGGAHALIYFEFLVGKSAAAADLPEKRAGISLRSALLYEFINVTFKGRAVIETLLKHCPVDAFI